MESAISIVLLAMLLAMIYYDESLTIEDKENLIIILFKFLCSKIF